MVEMEEVRQEGKKVQEKGWETHTYQHALSLSLRL